jgi:hypothetical protein
MKFSILVIHNVAHFSRTLRNIADYALCFERYAPNHKYVYHQITAPIPNVLRDIRFHAIIIDSTALSMCRDRPRERWYALKERLSFIGESDAAKLVFPQDDYHQSEMLDELFDDWNCDVVYTVMPAHHELLYPRSRKRSRLEVVLTGYVDDNSVAQINRFAKAFDARTIDLGQRVTMYPARGGRYAQLKGKLALAAKEHAMRRDLRVDVSTRDEDRIFGDDWFRFLGNCRFVTGSEGGVSLWDPDGTLFDSTYEYTLAHPKATFEEIEQACFPGLDGKLVFSAVSPRLFECAMLQCCQILTEAPYLGVLKPGEHYIPVKPDLSNIGDAIDEMRDVDAAKRRINACYETLIEAPEFRYSTLVEMVMRDINEIVTHRHVTGMSDIHIKRFMLNHRVQGAVLAVREYSNSLLRFSPVWFFGRVWVRFGRLVRRALTAAIFYLAVELNPGRLFSTARKVQRNVSGHVWRRILEFSFVRFIGKYKTLFVGTLQRFAMTIGGTALLKRFHSMRSRTDGAPQCLDRM